MTVKVKYQLKREKPALTAKPVSRCARLLALAYCLERKIEAGELASYAQAARALGMSKARVSQIMALSNLPVKIQEEILTGRMAAGERRLRTLPRYRA